MILLLFFALANGLNSGSPEVQDNGFVLFTLNPHGEVEQAFAAAEQDQQPTNITFTLVNCLVYPGYCSELLIYVFPSVFYTSNKKLFEYTWQYTYGDFLEFSQKMQGKSVVHIKSFSELTQFAHIQSWFLLYFPESDPHLFAFDYLTLFEEVANIYKHTQLYFARTSNFSLVSQLGRPNRKSRILHMGFENNYNFHLDYPFNWKELLDFIESHKCMLNLKLTYTNWVESQLCFKDKLVAIQVINSKNPDDMEKVKQIRDFMHSELVYNEKIYTAAYIDLSQYPKLSHKFQIYQSYALLIKDQRTPTGSFYLGEQFFKSPEFFSILDKVWSYQSIENLLKKKPVQSTVTMSYLILPMIILIIIQKLV